MISWSVIENNESSLLMQIRLIAFEIDLICKTVCDSLGYELFKGEPCAHIIGVSFI